jgi:hypothetical protein
MATGTRPAAAGRVALIECAQNADRQQHAGSGIAQGGPGLARPPIALAGDRHRAAAGLRDHVEGEIVLVGAAFAEPLHLGIDEARVEVVQHRPAEPQSLDRPWSKVFDENIGPARHLFDEREPAFGFQIYCNRFLIGVVNHEVISIGARPRPAAEYPSGLAAFRVFDLDDLGAEPSERLGAGRPGLELREIENPHSLKAVRRHARSIHRPRSYATRQTNTIKQSGVR